MSKTKTLSFPSPNYKPGFPRKYNNTPAVKMLVNSLLQRDRSKRLGCLKNEVFDIYDHPFFGKTEKERNLFFSKIYYQTLTSEYVPKVSGS